MTAKIAINGFGRIGRLAFRKMFADDRFEIAAVNDLATTEMLAYLLKHDSVQGKFPFPVESDEENIIVDGRKIKIYKEADPAKLPWKELGIDIVLECTGFFASKAKSQAHIDAGARKVVISAPAGNDLPTVVYGVNQGILKESDNIISAASCTTNCLAPMAKALNEYREIRTGFMTTIHAYTGDQMILDGPHRKKRFQKSEGGSRKYCSQQYRSGKGHRTCYSRAGRQAYGIGSESPCGKRVYYGSYGCSQGFGRNCYS